MTPDILLLVGYVWAVDGELVFVQCRSISSLILTRYPRPIVVTQSRADPTSLCGSNSSLSSILRPTRVESLLSRSSNATESQ